jgi:hypothetical protein
MLDRACAMDMWGTSNNTRSVIGCSFTLGLLRGVGEAAIEYEEGIFGW